jgi:hypothetical protein
MEIAATWEYTTMKLAATEGFLGGKFDEAGLNIRLNDLGKQGWELVSAFTTQRGYGQSRDIVAIFKRMKQ